MSLCVIRSLLQEIFTFCFKGVKQFFKHFLNSFTFFIKCLFFFLNWGQWYKSNWRCWWLLWVASSRWFFLPMAPYPFKYQISIWQQIIGVVCYLTLLHVCNLPTIATGHPLSPGLVTSVNVASLFLGSLFLSALRELLRGYNSLMQPSATLPSAAPLNDFPIFPGDPLYFFEHLL